MTCEELTERIKKYRPFNEQEEADKVLILDWIRNNKNAFFRENMVAHMTASAWVVNKDRSKVLMIYHNIYNSWSWLGGHADGETDLLAVAIREVKEEAGISGGDNVYINAHGTGTHLNDSMETKAIKEVFGEAAYKLHISSTKSMTGHMLGATGAVELIASALALKDKIVPPTINYVEKDPECDLDYTPNKAVKADIEYAMSSSLGFGGHNAVLLLKKYQ